MYPTIRALPSKEGLRRRKTRALLQETLRSIRSLHLRFNTSFDPLHQSTISRIPRSSFQPLRIPVSRLLSTNLCKLNRLRLVPPLFLHLPTTFHRLTRHLQLHSGLHRYPRWRRTIHSPRNLPLALALLRFPLESRFPPRNSPLHRRLLETPLDRPLRLAAHNEKRRQG